LHDIGLYGVSDFRSTRATPVDIDLSAKAVTFRTLKQGKDKTTDEPIIRYRWTISIIALSLIACSPNQDAQKLRPDDLDTVTQGKTIYSKHCAVCHGAALEGQPDWQKRLANGRLPAPHDDSGHTWHHTDAVLINITRVGP